MSDTAVIDDYDRIMIGHAHQRAVIQVHQTSGYAALRG